MINIKLTPLIIFALCTSAFASDEADIKAVHTAFAKVALTNDIKKIVKAADAMMAKDFTMVQGGQTMSKTQWMEMVKSQMGMAKISKWSFSHKNIKVKGNTATLVTTLVVSATMKNPQTGKDSKIDSTSVSNETMVKNGGKWQVKKLVSVSDKTLIDGKPAGG